VRAGSAFWGVGALRVRGYGCEASESEARRCTSNAPTSHMAWEAALVSGYPHAIRVHNPLQESS